MRVFVKDPLMKERIIADVRAEEKHLFGCRMRQRDEHVGNVLRARQSRRRCGACRQPFAREKVSRRRRRNRKVSGRRFPPVQNVAGKHVKIKIGEMERCPAGENRVNQSRIIENGIARFRSLSRSTRETWSVCERASVRTMKSKSAAVNRARQIARIIEKIL